MWRTLASPVLHRQVAILKSSRGNSTLRLPFIHITTSGNEASIKDAAICSNLQETIPGVGYGLSRAHSTVVGLVRKLSDIDKPYNTASPSLVNFLLEYNQGRHEGSTDQTDLTICSPRNEENGKHSGFGYRNLYLAIEKWCYGIVVVSTLISGHRLFLNNETCSCKNDMLCHIFHESSGILPSYILPVNGPAKPVDPIDAAISSFQNAMTECTAVTQNALGIKFSALKLHEKAVTYFKSASNKGNIAAHFNLGLCYEKGIGAAKDISKAIHSYRLAASQGHLEALYNLGGIYLEGRHIREKNVEGLELIEKAAREGLTKAQSFLGLYYADVTNDHYDIMTSVKWLQIAADQNDMIAQYHLGICHERGLGIARNMRKAKNLYRQAAENGHPGAQYNFAVFHEQGLGGLSVDKHEALRWYKMASDGGNMNAKHNLESLEKELRNLQKTKGKSSLLELLLPGFLNSNESVTPAEIIPRCASSPDRLYLTTEVDMSHDSAGHNHVQHRTFEDKKCIWVI